MLSIIIPFHNEEKNLTLLTDEIRDVLKHHDIPYEVLLIDNGSIDKSWDEAQHIAKNNHHVKPFRLRVIGKGRALSYGVSKAKGELIVFMDGDLQDNPADLPRFINKIEEGYDLVNGIRTIRKDNEIIRLYSNFANKLLRFILHSPFTDINCGFKIMRKSVLDEISLYANNFRFLPVAAFYKGFKVGEIPVDNRSRKFGISKYRASKLFIGLIDTFNAYFLYQFSERPLHFFGIIGSVFFMIGLVIALILTIERIFFNMLLYRRPALLYGIVLIIVGIQIILTGFIGELIVYINKKTNQ